jgi:serine/threonine-protein kinase
MELLSGQDLANEVRKGELISWPRIKSIVLQTCSALQAAHDAGIVHRDLKPENMFLIERLGHPDFVKVLDFGIAKLTELEESGRRLTRTGMVFGTPEYMSPEQARGDKTDHRVDVYAMGCILFQLVTGDVPFRAETFMGVLTRHLFEEVPTLASRVNRPDLPPGLEAVISRALAKDRDQRYASMHELALAIDQLDLVPGVAYYPPGAARPATATGQAAALQTPVPRTPPGGVPHPTASGASAPTRLEISGSGTGKVPALSGPAAATVLAPAGAAPVGTPVPVGAVGGSPEGPTMADLAGQRFTSPPSRGKRGPLGLIIAGVLVVGGGIGVAIGLGGGDKAPSAVPGLGGADAGQSGSSGPRLHEQTIDAGPASVANVSIDAGAPGREGVVGAPTDAGVRRNNGKRPPGDGKTNPPGDGKTNPPGDGKTNPPGDAAPGDGKPLKDPFKSPPG